MKKLFMSAIALAFLVGCGDDNDNDNKQNSEPGYNRPDNVGNPNTDSTTHGGGKPENAGNDGIHVDENGNVVTKEEYINSLPKEDLSEAEKESLLYVREEEKLARDVYLYLYDKYQVDVFKNIADSEQTHTDTVKLLLDKYGLEDSASSERGVFNNPVLQEKYNELIEKGSQDLPNAIDVGLTIEELDISDLKNRIEESDNQDIDEVFSSLEKGSENHLRAFYSQSDKTYQPQFISQEEYDAIINSEHTTGNDNAQQQNASYVTTDGDSQTPPALPVE